MEGMEGLAAAASATSTSNKARRLARITFEERARISRSALVPPSTLRVHNDRDGHVQVNSLSPLETPLRRQHDQYRNIRNASF